MLQHLPRFMCDRAQSIMARVRSVRRCLTEAELASYVDDLAGPEEARRVERHVRGCAACADALEEAHLLLLGLPAESSFLPPAALLGAVLRAAAEIHEGKAAAAVRVNRWAPARRVAWAVPASLLAVAIPAIACLAGYGFLRQRSEAPDRSAAGPAACTPRMVCTNVQPLDAAPGGAILKTPAEPPIGLSVLIDQKLSSAAQQALAESGLPQTPEQREVWARKEFPHVMALYDLIQAGASSVGILGVSTEPACVLVVPWARADDIEALTRFELIPQAAGGWNGAPVRTPEWAGRLYAGSAPLSGWQALLVLSGEIFKLDCPQSAEERNVNPTIEGVLLAAAVAGWDVRDGADLADLLDQRLRPQSMAVTPEYVNTLASNLELAQSVVAYIAVSSELVQTPAFMEVATLAKSFLEETYSSTSPCKRSVQTRRVLLRDLFGRRQEALNAMIGRMPAAGVR